MVSVLHPNVADWIRFCHPYDEIKEIDDLIAKNQSEAETKAKYEAAIKEADDFYAANDYEQALGKYKAALSIKDDSYPKERISELEEKISVQKAAEEKEKEFKNWSLNNRFLLSDLFPTIDKNEVHHIDFDSFL